MSRPVLVLEGNQRCSVSVLASGVQGRSLTIIVTIRRLKMSSLVTRKKYLNKISCYVYAQQSVEPFLQSHEYSTNLNIFDKSFISK